MNNFFTLNIAEVGLFLLGLGYIVTFWRQGGNQASTEVISALKEQSQINQVKISDLTHEIGVLTGQLKEKDERLKLLEGLVQGRSPEQTQYMDDMRKFTEGVAKYMDTSSAVSEETRRLLSDLNAANHIIMQSLNIESK